MELGTSNIEAISSSNSPEQSDIDVVAPLDDGGISSYLHSLRYGPHDFTYGFASHAQFLVVPLLECLLIMFIHR